MLGAWTLSLTMLLCSAACNGNSIGQKQAVIGVGGLSDIQSGLLRTARLDADPSKGKTIPDLDADLQKLMTPDVKSKVADSNPDMTMSSTANGSSNLEIDGDLKKLIDADHDSEKASSNNSDHSLGDPEMKNLMASLSQPSNVNGSLADSLANSDSSTSKDQAKEEDALKAADNDPEMDKAMAGIDSELKQENSNESADTTKPTDKDPLKFDSLNRLIGDLKTEEKENGDQDKSVKELDHLDGSGKGHMEQVSKDLEQSLADLDADLNETSSLPNAASLLELEVDEGTNSRMSMMLHNMGKMGAQIKHLSRHIDHLQRLHDIHSQNGAILSHVQDTAAQDSGKLATGNAMLDKELAEVEKQWHKISPGAKSLTQAQASSSADASKEMAWVGDMLAKNGGEKIDHEADEKAVDALLAKYEAMYPNQNA